MGWRIQKPYKPADFFSFLKKKLGLELSRYFTPSDPTAVCATKITKAQCEDMMIIGRD